MTAFVGKIKTKKQTKRNIRRAPEAFATEVLIALSSVDLAA